MKRIKNDWGHDPRRGWWYEVKVDGHVFARSEGYDSESTMDAAMDASMSAAREHVYLDETARDVAETETRGVVIVATHEHIAAALADAVRTLWNLPVTTALVPMVAFAERPTGLRIVGAVFVELDQRAPDLRLWMRDTFGHFPMNQIAHIGGVGLPGKNLLQP